MKVKALISFSAYGIHARPGEEFEIKDKGQKLELERLGWVEPIGMEISEINEGVKKVKKATKKAETD